MQDDDIYRIKSCDGGYVEINLSSDMSGDDDVLVQWVEETYGFVGASIVLKRSDLPGLITKFQEWVDKAKEG